MRKAKLKKCSQCQQELSLEYFYKLGKDRIDSWCKLCRKKIKKSKYKPKSYAENYRGFMKLLDWYFDLKLSELSEFEEVLERMVRDAKTTGNSLQQGKLRRAKRGVQSRSSGCEEPGVRKEKKAAHC